MTRLFIIAIFFIIGFAIGNFAFADDTIRTENTVISDGEMDTTINSPPPSAISPQISASNSDLCTVGVAGAVQTQILGISAGRTVRDMNCEKLKNAKTMYDMGMKVAAVSVMCQDERVFDAMMNAGTPCPKDGLIGDKAKLAWEMAAKSETLEREKNNVGLRLFYGDDGTKTGISAVLAALAFLLLL
tara:strand:+ start:27 stop:587 length:561 start_codon:yes stop_codon:yes gene_type:complete